jgi:hypothetical protein
MALHGRPRHTSHVGTTSTDLQGWYDDPFRLHEARYFSAGRPTKLVRDGDTESYDEPPGDGSPGSGTPVSSGPAVTQTPNRAEPGAVGGPPPPGDEIPYAGLAYARRKPRAGLLTGIGAIVIAGAVTAAVLTGHSRPATGPATALTAYTATMNANSADVYESFSISTGNHEINAQATESGAVSWATGQGNLTMKTTAGSAKTTGSPVSFTSRQIIDGRKAYSKTTITNLPASIRKQFPQLNGWTEMTWTSTSSSDLTGTLPGLLLGGTNPAEAMNPASLLKLLRAQATSVQDLGGQVVDGISTTHYRALVPLSQLGATSSAELQQAEQVLGTDSIAIDYWTDSSNLLRQLTFGITASQPPSGTTTSSGSDTVTIPASAYPLTMSLTVRLSHYGTPVHVTPPPSSQITSRGTCEVTKDGGFNCST